LMTVALVVKAKSAWPHRVQLQAILSHWLATPVRPI
jgi:hypothetical protein